MARKNRKGPAPTAKASPPAARPASVAQARYDAAGNGRRMRGWHAPSTGPNRAIEGLETLRNRARDANRNESAGTSGTRVWTTNLIGIGIYCRPEEIPSAKGLLSRPSGKKGDPRTVKELLTELWDEWTPLADADGVLNFYGLQTLAVRSFIASGEVFVRVRPRRIDDGLAVPVQFELLESDMLPQVDFDAWPGMQTGARIRQGIELDQIGRRIAYWMYRDHPGDSLRGTVSWADLVRVPANQICHLYEPLRPKQLRGVPEQSPILAKLRSVANFDDATLFRQELGNLFAGIIERPERKVELRSNPDGSSTWYDALTNQPVEFDGSGSPMVGLEPGTMQELGPGEKVTFTSPPDAGANYGDFMRWQHMQISAGSGTPYELLTGDIRDISDRTLRVIINEFRRHCEQRQWQYLIPMLQWIRNWWAESAFLAGQITPDLLAQARRVIWSPQAWPYIHPTQDVQARRSEVDAGFRSQDDVIATTFGNDPEKVAEERARIAAREQRLEIGAWAPTPDIKPPPPSK